MPLYVKKPVLMMLKAAIHQEAVSEFITWQANLNSTLPSFSGFISLEFLSPKNEEGEWVIVQRFTNQDSAHAWAESTKYKLFINELKDFAVENTLKEDSAEESSITQGVTEVFVTEISPKHEEDYRRWSSEIHLAEAKFEGFRGVYVQSPNEIHGKYWITLLQFDTMENLDRWLNSEERKALLNKSKPMISYFESQRVISPYAGWFSTIIDKGVIPPVWKQTMLILLVLFPIVMFELKYLNPLTASFNGSLATFVSNSISVTLISFPFLPVALMLLGWWMSSRKKWTNLLGFAILLFLYMLEIILFWDFLP